MVSHKDSMLHTTQKAHKKTNGKNTGGREALKSRGKGTRKKPSRGRQESSNTRGSHPGQESRSVSGGETYIPQSLGTKRNQEGWPSWVLLGGIQTKWNQGSPWGGFQTQGTLQRQ